MARRLLTGLLLSAISLTLTLMVLELVARVVDLGKTPYRTTRIDAVPRTDKDLPNFRQPGYWPPPKADTFRILVVGDSFSWGHGVHAEDTYARRLEVRLNAVSRGERFEVINWSRSGWNTVMEKRSLEGNLEELSPDLLILGFTLNDPEPFSLQEVGELRHGLARRSPRAGLSRLLFEHSHLYSLVWNRVENTRQRRAFNAYYPSLYEGQYWKTCKRALRRIRTMAKNREIPMLLVIFPIFDSQFDNSYPYRDLHNLVRQTGESIGVAVLDLFSTYEDIDAYRLAVVPFTDAHPNELGHRLAADAILEHLVWAELIPPVDHSLKRR